MIKEKRKDGEGRVGVRLSKIITFEKTRSPFVPTVACVVSQVGGERGGWESRVIPRTIVATC